MDIAHRTMNMVLHKLMIFLDLFQKFRMKSSDFLDHLFPGALWQGPLSLTSACHVLSMLCCYHVVLYEVLVIIVYDNGVLIGAVAP